MPARVWLFGGQIADIKDPNPLSLRDRYYRHVHSKDAPLKNQLELPESYPEWLLDIGYPDLMEFECDAGYLSKLIVIFSESVGSWVELGAFANNEGLVGRTFIVIPEKHRNADSFVNLGAIKRLERHHPESVCVIPAERHTELDDTDCDTISKSIAKRLRETHNTEKLKTEDPTHQLLQIADMADLFHATHLEVILESLNYLGINFNRDDLWRKAKLLNTLGLIKTSEYGTEKIIKTAGKEFQPLIDYQGLNDQIFDRMRFKISAFEIMKTNPQLSRSYGAS